MNFPAEVNQVVQLPSPNSVGEPVTTAKLNETHFTTLMLRDDFDLKRVVLLLVLEPEIHLCFPLHF